MSEKKCKIIMITMFKNEAPVLKRMLESCLPYVDYYVMQNNGSTDGSDEIAKQFLVDNKLSGEVYVCEEGWKGFGWNRDHLIQYCQNLDHGCDWILKMDCDEVLEVDDDFDWSPLDNKETQAFHIAAISGNAIYYRAWLWNAKLPWRFNHDPCHETIYCPLEGIGENFIRVDLPSKIRQIGYNTGQSWSDPYKFISHALVLEEKMIKENSLLTDTYHFWYIAKSYYDAFKSDSFPLKEIQQREFAKRAIFYFQEYVNYVHDFRNTKVPKHIDELSYMSLIFAAECYHFVGDIDACVLTYLLAEPFAPGRNDHLIGLAYRFYELKDFKNMLKYTSILMQPERVCPFPMYASFIDTTMYIDGGTRVQELHQIALDNTTLIKETKMTTDNIFAYNPTSNKRLFVVDNFYTDPDAVRQFALTQAEYKEDVRFYKGLRSVVSYHPPGIKERLEAIIGEKITSFEEGTVNGCFQIVNSNDKQVYHYDLQKWAAMVYLTPNAPTESGTRLHRSKLNGTRHSSEEGVDGAFEYGYYDGTKFETLDSVSNIYNRMIIMDAKCLHSAGPYFGNTAENGRLTHLFFFD